MKTEYDYGYEYAEWLSQESPGDLGVGTLTDDIPQEDYNEMVRAGIENPDAGAYWSGFNSHPDVKAIASDQGE